VLTVDADEENAQAFVAHDAGVPLAALVAAANRAGGAAQAVSAPCATAAPIESGAPGKVQRRSYLAAAGLAAMLAIVLIDFALPNSPDKRWLFIIAIVLLWGFTLLRSTRARRL
jgi:hypothetical protein